MKCSIDVSSTRVVSCGVPQGSVLGLLLFLRYADELLQAIDARGLLGHAYADDTQMYGSCPPSKASALRCNALHYIEDVTGWTASNRFKLNPAFFP